MTKGSASATLLNGMQTFPDHLYKYLSTRNNFTYKQMEVTRVDKGTVTADG
jgi:hypothetical protein